MQNASASPSAPAHTNTLATFPFDWEVLSASDLGDRVLAEMKLKDTARCAARTKAEAAREAAREKRRAAPMPLVVMGQRQQRRLEQRQWQKSIEQAKRAAARGPVVPSYRTRQERRRAASLAGKPTT